VRVSDVWATIPPLQQSCWTGRSRGFPPLQPAPACWRSQHEFTQRRIPLRPVVTTARCSARVGETGTAMNVFLHRTRLRILLFRLIVGRAPALRRVLVVLHE
jgi:hypothetical protein